MWVLGFWRAPVFKNQGSIKEIEYSKSVILGAFWIELKSLILAQIERWRHALHMQVERVPGACFWR